MRAAEGGIRGFVSGRVSVRNAGETAGCDGYVQEGARGIGKANPISRELGLADYCLLTPRWAYVPYCLTAGSLTCQRGGLLECRTFEMSVFRGYVNLMDKESTITETDQPGSPRKNMAAGCLFLTSHRLHPSPLPESATISLFASPQGKART